MINRILIAVAAGALLLAQSAFAQQAARPVPAAPQLTASSYILVDFDSKRVLVSDSPDSPVAPASITKLMTSYVVFSELRDGNLALDEIITVSEKAWRTGGSRMYIEVNTEVDIEALVKGMVIQSGNDASVALAEHIAGSEAAFADLMNHFAQLMGMSDTNYVNATGLPHEDHYTTAGDVAILSAALIRDFPVYYRWYSEKEYTYNNIRQHNRNTLLWRDPAVDGLKTGHTEAAGYCLASSAKKDGMRLIAVVLGSSSEQSRTTESQALLNYGFRFFETYQLYQGGDELARPRVWKATQDDVPLGLGEDLFVTIPRGRFDALDAQVKMQSNIVAPLANGQQIGDLEVMLDGDLVASRPLLSLIDLPESGFFGRSVDGLRLWFGGFFSDEE